jgi:hypothetical protein
MKKLSLLAFAFGLLPSMAAAQATVEPLALRAAADYLEQARYPDGSSVLAAGSVDPLVNDRTPTRQSRLGPDGVGPRLTVWASTVSALPGETVTLFATLTHTGSGTRSLLESAPLPGSVVTGAQVTGALTGLALGDLGTVTYRDDGLGPDAVAGDGIYTARYTLPTAKTPALGQADSVMVAVDALLPDNQLRRAAGGFQFSNPAARLTGRFTDAVRDGNLVIAAELEVLAPGRVHIAGTLADLLGQPFATAQNAQTLQPGTQWVELGFYGLAFHDSNVAGAVRLASVSVTSASSMPNALGPVLSDALVTRAYSLTQFTNLPFNNPELLDAAKRLQDSTLPKLVPATGSLLRK